MELILVLSVFFLVLSLSGNAYLFYRFKKPAPKMDYSAVNLLHDLTGNGQALVRIEPIDINSILIRRPGA